MARLVSPGGASVDVPDSKVAGLLRMRFTRPEEEPKVEPPKKAAPKKSSK